MRTLSGEWSERLVATNALPSQHHPLQIPSRQVRTLPGVCYRENDGTLRILWTQADLRDSFLSANRRHSSWAKNPNSSWRDFGGTGLPHTQQTFCGTSAMFHRKNQRVRLSIQRIA